MFLTQLDLNVPNVNVYDEHNFISKALFAFPHPISAVCIIAFHFILFADSLKLVQEKDNIVFKLLERGYRCIQIIEPKKLTMTL